MIKELKQGLDLLSCVDRQMELGLLSLKKKRLKGDGIAPSST